ncbi:EAL domain-containing protein [bacterium]|nr:EAL domain-containing protein [bacterium]MBU1883650.1 EAL domain-containing protein [bacterium]
MKKYQDHVENIEQSKLEKLAYQYSAIIETTSDGYWVSDMQGHFLEVNNRFCTMSGYSREELLTMKIPDIEASESPQETKQHIETIIKTGSDRFETRHRKKNGTIYEVEITTTFSTIDGGNFFVFVRDITKRKKNEKDLMLSAKVFSTMTDGVVITDVSEKIINANDAFCRNTGYTLEELVGKAPSILSSGWHDGAFYKDMWKQIRDEGNWKGEIIDRRKDGEVYTSETSIVAIKDKNSDVAHYIAVSSDITMKKEQEKVIKNLAYYDTLTQLPNRAFFEERFNNKIASAKRKKSGLALLFIDLDNFKTINDSYGHFVGDKFLKNAAQRLKNSIREEDIIGRFGGDEFMVLIEDFTTISNLAVLANKIVELFNQPFILENNEFFSGASIGISVYPDNGTTYHDLMKAADTAMYHAKASGKGGFKFYSKTMGDTVSERIGLDSNLRSALSNKEFHLVYQPKVDLTVNKVYGMEALIRWINPALGFVPPDKFIPILEENGLIYEIGLWIIRQALSDTKKFHDAGNEGLIVSINISYIQIENDRFLSDLKAIVDEIGVAEHLIELEITESQIMNNIEAALVKLREITSCGIKISIDDFGTGYSSLSYLKKLPAEIIKIDKSFVLDIDKDEDDRSIVQAIIALSKSLNKNVIAEGSETQTHIDTLKELGCTKVQGYFYSKPLKFDEFLAYVTNF